MKKNKELKSSKSVFSMTVDQAVIDEKMSYIEAVVKVSESFGIDLEDVSDYLTDSLKEKIEIEAKKLNLVKSRILRPHNIESVF